MQVIQYPSRTVTEISGPLKVKSILSQLQLNPETVLVMRSGELLTADREVKDEEEIEIWPVISGGGNS